MSRQSAFWGIDLPYGVPEWTDAMPKDYVREWHGRCGLLSFAEGMLYGVRYAVCRNDMGIVCSYVDVGWHPAVRLKLLLPGGFSDCAPYEYDSPHGGWTYFGYGLPFEKSGGGLVAGCDYGHYGDVRRLDADCAGGRLDAELWLWSKIGYEDALADVRCCINGLKAAAGT